MNEKFVLLMMDGYGRADVPQGDSRFQWPMSPLFDDKASALAYMKNVLAAGIDEPWSVFEERFLNHDYTQTDWGSGGRYVSSGVFFQDDYEVALKGQGPGGDTIMLMCILAVPSTPEVNFRYGVVEWAMSPSNADHPKVTLTTTDTDPALIMDAFKAKVEELSGIPWAQWLEYDGYCYGDHSSFWAELGESEELQERYFLNSPTELGITGFLMGEFKESAASQYWKSCSIIRY